MELNDTLMNAFVYVSEHIALLLMEMKANHSYQGLLLIGRFGVTFSQWGI
jgi:hypothetical protein